MTRRAVVWSQTAYATLVIVAIVAAIVLGIAYSGQSFIVRPI